MTAYARPLLAIIAVLAAAGAAAAPLDLPESPYRYTVIDQDLRSVLQEFGANLGVRMDISAPVQGRVHGRLPELSPRGFLDHLGAKFEFDWYFDGHVLHISAAEENQSRLVDLASVPFDELRQSLEALEIWDERFVVRPHAGAGLAAVSGPPRYLALIEETIAALSGSRVAPPAPSGTLTIYRGAQTSVLQAP